MTGAQTLRELPVPWMRRSGSPVPCRSKLSVTLQHYPREAGPGCAVSPVCGRGSSRAVGPPGDPNEQLVKHLTDVHSIEEQALTQLRRAPKIAGDPRLAGIFEEHLLETERQERLVSGRLDAHGAEPSTVKDLAGKAGGGSDSPWPGRSTAITW